MQEIQISMLNHYAYCIKRAYICYIHNDFIDNEYTIEGSSIHRNVDSGLITKRKELLQIRSIWLKSEKYHLFGKADMVEEKKGEIYPVEYKRGKARNWKNDQVQLTAQALCLEEMLNLDKKIDRGFIYYHLSNCREEVVFDEDIRQSTINMINEIQDLCYLKTPQKIEFGKKCLNCSIYPICITKEVEKIKNIIKNNNNLDFSDS